MPQLTVVPSLRTHFEKLKMKYAVNYAVEESPIGTLLVATVGKFLCCLSFKQEDDVDGIEKEKLETKFPHAESIELNVPHVRKVIDAREITKIDVERLEILVEGTPFQEQVWRELLKIPRGKIAFYSDLAERICKPSATRAVGSAVGRNPIGYIIPCHRVVCKSGKCLKFAAGPEVKKRLLKREGNIEGQNLNW